MTLEILRPLVSRPGQPVLVGLTGGIGTGKSTVAALLAEAGALVVDADQLARDVVAPGSAGLSRVAAAFGPAVLGADGTLDRHQLGQIVFADREARLQLERILHPLIAAEKARRFAAVSPGQLGVYDVPLLVENQMQDDFDTVVVVESPLDLRLARLEQRGMPAAAALRRMSHQASDADRRAVAHAVIRNAGSRADLASAASEFFAACTP